MNDRLLPRKCVKAKQNFITRSATLKRFCISRLILFYLKVQMRKLIKQHEEKEQKSTVDEPTEGAIPTYLLDRQKQAVGKAISSAVKQKRKEKAVSFLWNFL